MLPVSYCMKREDAGENIPLANKGGPIKREMFFLANNVTAPFHCGYLWLIQQMLTYTDFAPQVIR